MSRLPKMMGIAAVLTMLGSCQAANAEDTAGERNYRCEAAKLRAESRELLCQGKCTVRAAAQPEDQRAVWTDDCFDDCHKRCDDDKERIDLGRFCRDETVPNPDRCAGKLLAALARFNFCLAGCPEEAPTDQAVVEGTRLPRSMACVNRCAENHAAAEEKISKATVCAEGRFPVCAYQ